jgi:hypothetical protein
MTTFENIQLNNEVIFENNNQKYTGIVVEIKKNIFTITCLMCYTKPDGTKSFHNQYFNFMKKSGKKASYRNTYGNAISFSKSFEQQINNMK